LKQSSIPIDGCQAYAWHQCGGTFNDRGEMAWSSWQKQVLSATANPAEASREVREVIRRVGERNSQRT